MAHTVKIPDIDGNLMDAVVGDEVLAYCITSKKIRRCNIQGIKKGFSVTWLKYSPRAAGCIWLANAHNHQGE